MLTAGPMGIPPQAAYGYVPGAMPGAMPGYGYTM